MGTTQALLVETGDKRDGRGHGIAALARRAELVAEYRRSDRVRGSGRATPSPGRFAQVQLPAVTAGSVASLEVRLPDGTVARGSSAAELELLVRASRA